METEGEGLCYKRDHNGDEMYVMVNGCSRKTRSWEARADVVRARTRV